MKCTTEWNSVPLAYFNLKLCAKKLTILKSRLIKKQITVYNETEILHSKESSAAYMRKVSGYKHTQIEFAAWTAGDDVQCKDPYPGC